MTFDLFAFQAPARSNKGCYIEVQDVRQVYASIGHSTKGLLTTNAACPTCKHRVFSVRFTFPVTAMDGELELKARRSRVELVLVLLCAGQ